MGSGWDLFQLAYRNSISCTITASTGFFSGKSPVLYFFGGGKGGDYRGGGGEFYCCNLNHDTRHNLITWNSVKIIYSKGNITRHQTHF